MSLEIQQLSCRATGLILVNSPWRNESRSISNDSHLTSQHQEWTETEDRFRMMANAAPVMIWMSGPDAECSFFNQRWLEFTGRSMAQEIGSGWTTGVHPEDVT